LRLCMKSFKIQLYLVLSGLGWGGGVKMPHCTPLGYATGYRGPLFLIRYRTVLVNGSDFFPP
jgi:hypothetical protein